MRVRGLGAPRVRAAPIGDPSGGHASGGVLSSTSPPPPLTDLCDPHRDETSAQKHASRVDNYGDLVRCGTTRFA